ncbi:MAG: OmpA family protein [Pseudomonadota bacterium]
MKRVLILSCLLSTMAFLNACETVQQNNIDVVSRNDFSVSEPLTPELQTQTGSDLSLVTNSDIGNQSISVDEMIMTPEVIQPVAPIMAAPVGDNPFVEMINNTGDPSVTIFPLDGPVPQGAMVMNQQITLQDRGSDFLPPVVNMNQNMPLSGNAGTQIFFKHGSSRLGQGDMHKLNNVAQTAPMNAGRIVVEGHASTRAQTSDPVRSSILNLKESMNRSFAVSKALIQEGVPANRLKTVAYGDTVPAGGEEQQRRVDIITGQ